MENRFEVQSSGRSYVVVCKLTGKRTDYTIGEWLDAYNLCATLNASQPHTQAKEVSEFFV